MKKQRLYFVMGWIGTGLGIAAGLFLRSGVLNGIHGVDLCVFHRLTGYYCPGCGITRACFLLADLNLPESFLFHPVPLCILSGFLIWLIRMSNQALRSRFFSIEPTEEEKAKDVRFYRGYERASIVLAGVLILQWIVKISLQFFGGIDWFELITRTL